MPRSCSCRSPSPPLLALECPDRARACRMSWMLWRRLRARALERQAGSAQCDQGLQRRGRWRAPERWHGPPEGTQRVKPDAVVARRPRRYPAAPGWRRFGYQTTLLLPCAQEAYTRWVKGSARERATAQRAPSRLPRQGGHRDLGSWTAVPQSPARRPHRPELPKCPRTAAPYVDVTVGLTYCQSHRAALIDKHALCSGHRAAGGGSLCLPGESTICRLSALGSLGASRKRRRCGAWC